MTGAARRATRMFGVFLVSLALAGCDIAADGHGLSFGVSAQATDEWARSYTIAPGGRLEIININGRVTAEVSDASSVELKAERIAKASTDERARELLGQIEMREEVGTNRVRVEVRAPRLSGFSGHEVKWTVRVPRGVDVDLRTVNGGVKMTGLEGEVRARTTNGGIEGVALAASSVDAAVTNGGVEIELAKPVSAGTFELEAVNGGVSIALPAESRADVSGRAVNGGVSVDGLPVEIVGEQTRRRLNGQLNGGGARVSLSTVNGGVRINGSGVTTTNR